jgi:hypothetical protein
MHSSREYDPPEQPASQANAWLNPQTAPFVHGSAG